MKKYNFVFIVVFLSASQVKADISGGEASFDSWLQEKEVTELNNNKEVELTENYKFNESILSSLELSKNAELNDLVVMVSNDDK